MMPTDICPPPPQPGFILLCGPYDIYRWDEMLYYSNAIRQSQGLNTYNEIHGNYCWIFRDTKTNYQTN